jgi:hypothetical protein
VLSRTSPPRAAMWTHDADAADPRQTRLHCCLHCCGPAGHKDSKRYVASASRARMLKSSRDISPILHESLLAKWKR